MIHSCSSRDFSHESLHNPIFTPSKLQFCHSSFTVKASVGFNFKSQKFDELRTLRFPYTSTGLKDIRAPNNCHFQKFSSRGRVFLGFKLHCHSKAVVLPAKVSNFNGKKKRYGGVLPSILRSLESDYDTEKTLRTFCNDLNPKEQTVILKEQRGWERVIRVFDFFKSQEYYVPNVIHYNIVLRALGRAQRWDELRLCWVEMAKNGVLPTNNTYGMLVDVYAKAGLVKEALLWIKHMRIRGLFPDEVTMNTVVRVLKEAKEYDRADKFYKEWCLGQLDLSDLEIDFVEFEKGSGSGPISFKNFLSTELFRTGGRTPTPVILSPPNRESSIRKPRLTSTYNTLIDLYGKAGRLKDAAEVFAEMLRSGVAMDTITFNTMMYTCGSHGLLSEAESLLSKMEEKGISPDTKTYNIFLSMYAAEGDIDAALKCYKKIRDVGLFPDDVTHRAILHKLSERNMVQEVQTVINEMEKSGLFIDEYSLPVVMKLYVNEGLIDRAKILLEKFQLCKGLSSKTRAAVMDAYAEKGLWEEAEALFSGRKGFIGQNKDVVEYNVMIKAYGKAKLYDKAFSLFREMRNHGTWPDECTYNSLIQMFSGGDLINEARDLLAEMQRVGFKPQCATFSAVIACYSRLGQLSDAVDVYKEMVEAGVKPNEVVYGSLINGFAESDRVEEAFRYFHMLEECGLAANQIVLTSLIKAYSKVGSLEGAKALFERIKDLDGGPDIVASNSMISLYADLGMVNEAKSVFDNLKERGSADGVTFATMMYLFKNMGMLDEAIDVAEEMKQSGLLKDCNSYNKVMACYATNGQLRECGDLLHEMLTQKLLPDKGTFKVLFTVLKKGGIPSEFVLQLESSYNEGKAFARQAIITCLYSLVGLHKLALEACETFQKVKLALDSSVYNVAIYAYGASGETDKAFNIFMKMQDEGLEPDLVTYINLVGCYGKAGMVEGVRRIYGQLKCGEIESSESLFKAIIDAYKLANRSDLAALVNQEMKFAIELGEKVEPDSDSASEYESAEEDEYDEISLDPC